MSTLRSTTGLISRASNISSRSVVRAYQNGHNSIGVLTPLISSRYNSNSNSNSISKLNYGLFLKSNNRHVFAAANSVLKSQTRHYSPLTEEFPAKIVEYEQVKKLSESQDPDLVIVDVREPDEFSEGHIPHAINIPLKSSPGALGLDKEEFEEMFGFDKPATDKTMLFYCLGGVRSTAAEQLASTYGYNKRLNYKGSWEDWIAREKSS